MAMASPAGGVDAAPAANRYNTRRRQGTRAAIRRAAEAVMRGEGVEDDGPTMAAPSSSTLAAAGLHDPEQMTWDQIKRVQSLIERCLAQYMTQVRRPSGFPAKHPPHAAPHRARPRSLPRCTDTRAWSPV